MLNKTKAKYAFEQLREEIRNRALEDINMLRISLDAQIEDLENHFETAHLNYLQQTAQRLRVIFMFIYFPFNKH